MCLCDQKFVKNTDLTINDLINELTLKLGEKISIRRFIKWNLGEGIEKKEDNLAEEVSNGRKAIKIKSYRIKKGL